MSLLEEILMLKLIYLTMILTKILKKQLKLSNWDFKKATGIDTSTRALKSNFTKLKSKVGKIGLDKLKTVPVDWSKLSKVVNNDVCVW